MYKKYSSRDVRRSVQCYFPTSLLSDMSLLECAQIFIFSFFIVMLQGCSAVTVEDENSPSPTLSRMLRSSDVPGGTALEESRYQGGTGCGPIINALTHLYSTTDEFPEANIDITTTSEQVVSQRLIYNSTHASDLMANVSHGVDACVNTSPFDYYRVGEVMERYEHLDSATLPEGIVGYRSVMTETDDGSAQTIERIIVSFTYEGSTGFMLISVMTPSGHPGELNPADLLDTALERAHVQIDPGILRQQQATASAVPTNSHAQ